MDTTTAIMNPEPPTAAAPSMKALLHQGLVALGELRRQRYLASKGLSPDSPEPKRTGLYVSEVGTVIGDSACWRKLWYNVQGTPRDPLMTEQMLAFAIGDRIEQLYIDALVATGELDRVQVPVPFAGLPITGRFDVLIRRDRRVIELKSVTVKQWSKLPKQEHLDQTLLYLHGMRALPAYADITEGLTVYLAKDAPKGHEGVLEIPVPYNADRAAEILASFEYAWGATQAQMAPPRPVGYTPNAWPCGYCPFASTCWSAANG